MSGAGQGYGEGFFYTPEDQTAQQAILRRQAYAKALMQGQRHEGQYGGLADAGNSIAGALIGRSADKQSQDLATKSQAKYSTDLAALLRGGGSGPSPQISNAPGQVSAQADPRDVDPNVPPVPQGPQTSPQLDPEGNPITSQAGTSPMGAALSGGGQAQPQSIMERIAASGNPALMYQFGPQALQAQMQNEMTRGNKVWENNLPMSRAATEQGAMNLQNQESAAKFTNALPQTAAEKAQTGLGYAQLNKPVQLSYGSTLVNPKTGQAIGGGLPGAPGSASPFGEGDPKSPSIQGQLGLSSAGLNYLTGNTSALGMRDKQMASREVDNMIARRGLDVSVVKPKIQAFQSAVNMNTLKANTMDTLAREVAGTVQNYSPIIDQLTGNGNLRLTNQGFQLVGNAVNDPTAQKAIFYLNQMRADMAGFNAASGGKIGVHGQTSTDNADFAKADEVIKNGLSSGGAKALSEAIEATRQKNVAVAQRQSDEAQRGIWTALGIGNNYDATHPQAAPKIPPPASGAKSRFKIEQVQ